MKRLFLVVFALFCFGRASAYAAEWPTQPIRLVVTVPAGTGSDRVARVMAQFMSDRLHVPVLVENRVGGGSVIGAMHVVRSKPDGYTFLISGVAVFLVAPTLMPDAIANPLDMFTDIAFIGGTPTCMVVSSSSDLKSIEDVKRAEQQGKSFFYSTIGIASLGNLIGEQTNVDAGLHLKHVPFTAINLVEVTTGRIDFGFFSCSSVRGLVESGELRVLAVSSRKRLPNLPDVPTFEEQHVRGTLDSWVALSGPKDLPDPIVQRMNTLVGEFMSDPSAQDRISADIAEVVIMSPEELTAFIKEQIATWKPRVDRALKPEQK